MSKPVYKILILGAHGMLGSTLLTVLKSKGHDVHATVRKPSNVPFVHGDIHASVQESDLAKLDQVMMSFRPDFVVNCIGIIKQLKESKMKTTSIVVNSLWPQVVLDLCKKHQSKLIHFSTDCVFSGTKGNYKEDDLADARDVYGLTKYMGEVDDVDAITLRTSIIGHELGTHLSLLDWFLSQKDSCFGYKNALYSGLTTFEVAQFMNHFLFAPLKAGTISGVYQLSSEAINKFDLLKLVAEVYEKKIEIKPNTDFVIDRTLDSTRLRQKLNYAPPAWLQQIKDLYQFYKTNQTLFKSTALE